MNHFRDSVMFFIVVVFFVLVISSSSNENNPITGFVTHPIYNGYAIPINSISVDTTLVFNNATDTATRLFEVNDDIVYRRAYVSYDGQSWTPFNLTPVSTASGEWIYGRGLVSLLFTPLKLRLNNTRNSSNNTYVIIYTCSKNTTIHDWSCHDGWQIIKFDARIRSSASWQTGLVSFWKFDGDASDSIGTNHGTVNGATLTSTGCKSGQCYSFDGVNDYILVPNSNTLDFPVSGTISLWVNALSPTSNYDMPLWRGGSSPGEPGYDFELGTGGWNSGISNGVSYLACDYSSSPLIGWHMLTFTFDTVTSKLVCYVDGTFTDDSDIPGFGGIDSSYNLYLGTYEDGSSAAFSGSLDEVSIWNRALNADEINSVYNSFNNGCTSSCSGKQCGSDGCGTNNNCGTCSLSNAVASCSASYQCVISSCNLGYANCDSNTINGCETTLGITSNCASCGNSCSGGQTCTNNVCVNSQTPTCGDETCNGAETCSTCSTDCGTCSSYSRTFYVSNSGSDSNSGTSQSAPWRTISYVNSRTFLPGDAILFERGDSWHESLIVSSSGSSGNPITYGAYGTGNKPVINGFTTVSGWTNAGGGIYSKVISTESTPVMVTVDDINTGMGRTPNTGWTVIDSDTINSLTDADLNSAVTNWRGAEVTIRVNYFVINHLPITSHSGNTLYYTDGTVYQPSAGSGNGYFIQNDLRTLDQLGEWYYNPGTSTFYIYFGSVNPTTRTVKMASLDNAVTISNHGYITFDSLSITGFNNHAFNLDVAPYITIRNCDITFCGSNAIDGTQSAYNIGASRNLIFSGNTVNDMGNDGLHIYGGFTNVVISNNTFNNIGLIRGAGYAKEIYAHQAIMINYLTGTSNGNTVIEYNNFTNIGYIPINFGGTNVIIRYNYIDYYDLILDDGGGIYTYDEDSDARDCTISNNIVLHGMGDGSGRLNPEYLATEGIYTDGYSNGITITGNTVAYCSQGGYFSNSNTGGVVTDNTFYSNHEGAYINGGMDNMNIQRNIFFARDANQYASLFMTSPPSSATLDYNYYTRPISETTTIMRAPYPTYNTLAQWKSTSGKDTHSSTATRTVTSVNDIRFEYNPTRENKIVTLDATYIDVKGATYSGSVTLQPYTSIVLIKN